VTCFNYTPDIWTPLFGLSPKYCANVVPPF
jgi:hypothetical protein